MLTAFGDEIWVADGTALVAAGGFHYPTRMAVIRLPDRTLLVWSPIALTDDLKTELEKFGTVAHLVAPNSLHHMFLSEWIEAYPQARTYAAPGLQSKRQDIAFDCELTDEIIPAWQEEVEQVVMRGNLIAEEVVLFHRRSGTVLFTDLLQQLPKGWFSGWRAMIAKLDLMSEAEPAVPRKFRLAFVKRRAARQALRRILAWPCDRVLMAHGQPVTREGQAFLRQAFNWLDR